MNIDLFLHIAELAPGFISVAIVDYLNGHADKGNEGAKNFKRYFVYAGINWIFIYLVKCYTTLQDSTYATLSIVFSIVFAVVWYFWLQRVCYWLSVKLHTLLGQNATYSEPWLLEAFVGDGKPHYLAVFKHDKLIAEGGLSGVQNDEYSLCIEQNKAWQEYYATHEHGERTIIYLDKDAYIKEYFIES